MQQKDTIATNKKKAPTTSRPKGNPPKKSTGKKYIQKSIYMHSAHTTQPTGWCSIRPKSYADIAAMCSAVKRKNGPCDRRSS